MAQSFDVFSRLFECPICLDLFKRPKMLPCQHTFCLPCITKVYASSGMSLSGYLKCPTCQTKHDLIASRKGLKAKIRVKSPSPGDLALILPNNLFIISAMDMQCGKSSFNPHSNASAPDPTDNSAVKCLDCNPNRQWFCTDCSCHLCLQCLSLHLDRPDTQLHHLYNTEDDRVVLEQSKSATMPTTIVDSNTSIQANVGGQSVSEERQTAAVEAETVAFANCKAAANQLESSGYADVVESKSTYVDVTNQNPPTLPPKKTKLPKVEVFRLPTLNDIVGQTPKFLPVHKLATFDDVPRRLVVIERVGIFVMLKSPQSAIHKLNFSGAEELRFGPAEIQVDLVATRKTAHLYCLQAFDAVGDGSLRYAIQSYSVATGQHHEHMTIGYERQIGLALGATDSDLITYDDDRESLNFYDFQRKCATKKIKLPTLLTSLSFSPNPNSQDDAREVVNITGDQSGKIFILFNQRPHIFVYPTNETVLTPVLLPLSQPSHVAIDHKRMYLCDPINSRIAIFSRGSGREITSNVSHANSIWRPETSFPLGSKLYTLDAEQKCLFYCTLTSNV